MKGYGDFFSTYPTDSPVYTIPRKPYTVSAKSVVPMCSSGCEMTPCRATWLHHMIEAANEKYSASAVFSMSPGFTTES